ncbi:MAG: bifunctional (p)ppGpp synthetase/guanosine-3',5'-bis(diphosphate) 3'-pyrophosphohydrolase [Oscillospiraceae bacterium]|nr:bifunctional (p)ppGpp synthetase/guanosine-3',5'-bis(diphosphate) 3'-pyrophosphohydrolase [Oscillospiraceae bacterium]
MATDVNKLYADLRKKMAVAHTEEELAVLDKAFNTAQEYHGDQLRRSGEPYIIHPIAVADILVDLGMDCPSLAAALLHDVVEDTPYTLEQLQADFGETVATIVDGVTKLGKVQISSRETKEEQQAENVRKMLLAMSKDIRVIIVKLADRLHNMRTLEFVDPQKQRDKALETLEIFAPISHRLGIRSVKEELEDRAIRFLDPVAYVSIEENLKNSSRSGNDFIESTKSKILERVQKTVPSAQISGRIKSVHGIYRKMYMQGKQFDEIYDIYAVRIIVDTVIDCYNCLGIIHDMYRPLPGRFKDYISTPKPNMYQSLHTTVIGKEGVPFEVQIRTWEMHRTAEFGIAAHWKYKLGMSGGKNKFDERLQWIRQMLEAQQEAGDAREIVSSIKTDLIPDEVFVYTPKGDVINIPQGSTVIDFAYAIHSAVGNKMMGAKVDGRIVPLDYVVKTGEICEILTSSQPGKGPSRDWLNIAKSSQARSKIRSWFKRERREENIIEGRAEIEREFKRNYIRLTEEDEEKFIKKLAERQRLDSIDDFYAAIGFGGISVNRLMPYIKDEYHKNYDRSREEQRQKQVKTAPRKTNSDGVTVEGIDNCLIKFSRCCNPLPGDPIIGFITRGHGVSIHKQDCTNVPKDIKNCAEPARWINAYWNKNVKEEYKATVTLTCLSRIGLMADVSMQVANMRVNITDINTRDTKDGRCILSITVKVGGIEHLKNLIAKIEKVDGVLSVER